MREREAGYLSNSLLLHTTDSIDCQWGCRKGCLSLMCLTQERLGLILKDHGHEVLLFCNQTGISPFNFYRVN